MEAYTSIPPSAVPRIPPELGPKNRRSSKFPGLEPYCLLVRQGRELATLADYAGGFRVNSVRLQFAARTWPMNSVAERLRW